MLDRQKQIEAIEKELGKLIQSVVTQVEELTVKAKRSSIARTRAIEQSIASRTRDIEDLWHQLEILEEAERRCVESEKMAEQKARTAVDAYQKTEKKPLEEKEEEEENSVAVSDTSSLGVDVDEPVASPGQLSAPQPMLMEESGKMFEYLRQEVFKIRSHNTQMRTDFDLLKDNNQRLMDANASEGASVASLNQHSKQLARTNDKLSADLLAYKQQVQKLSVAQVELEEELKMKQATYIAEVHSRLQYQKALSKIIDVAQERCRDDRLVEEFLRIADACEAEYMSGPTGMNSKAGFFFSPSKGNAKDGSDRGLMSSIRSFWS